MPYTKNKIAVKVQKRSGFDKTHRHSGTGFCGSIIPILCDELIPNSRVNLRLNIATQLPPLASDTYMNLKLKAEAFFVPMRILCASFEDYFCDFPRRVFTNDNTSSNQQGGSFTDITPLLPTFEIAASPSSPYIAAQTAAGSLLDYLGYKGYFQSAHYVNPLPLVAYHKVWEDWYRNPRVQNPAFAPNLGGYLMTDFNHSESAAYLPYLYFHDAFVGDGGLTSPANNILPVDASNLGSYTCADGVSIFSIRQRNFGDDYFTAARVSAQQGAAAGVGLVLPVDSGTGNAVGSFTISQLRAANSLQQFRERNNLPSPRLVDQVKARYNANLSDGVAQRAICIGAATYDVLTNGVNQTAEVSASSQNPFNSVAAQYGRAHAVGSDFLIDDFVANEPGYLLVNISLVPEVTYDSFNSHMFKRYIGVGSITDMACSLLQNVGDQPIYSSELAPSSTQGSVFGYTDRFADFMFMPNRVSGEFHNGATLDSFVLKRSGIANNVQLSTNFIEIPKNYLDSVFAVASSGTSLSYWFDSMLDYKVSMPLAEYSLPSLQDPAYEHGDTVVLRRNGQIF